MAIFYMDVKIIGRSSGRSAVGASAYRSGEKLRSNAVKSAAYGSGSKLRNGEIVHDYTKKKGVMHSEIILPENAPAEYADRQTLWNAVEASERRKDAQLAREIIVALPREFDLEEQIEVMRQYIKENFVSKGMIADFAIHHTGEGNLNSPAEGVASGVRNQKPEFAPHHAANPHAHIMLTTRNVSRDGFGLKNTNWNKKEFLLSCRKAWANIINSTLALKGSDERIDHRTYKEQGIDRKPMIHMGVTATALERQGIRTERGDYNREIERNNQTRTALNAAKFNIVPEKYAPPKTTTLEIQDLHTEKNNTLLQEAERMEIQKLEALTQKLEHIVELAEIRTNVSTTAVPNELITKLKTANRMNEAQENPDAPDKTPSVPNTEPPNIVKTAKNRKKMRQSLNTIELNLRSLKAHYNVHDVENSQLYSHVEEIDEQVKNIQTIQTRFAHEFAKRQAIWYPLLKKQIETKIKVIEADERIAQHHLWQKYRIYSDQAPERIEQILEQIRDNKTKMETINRDISTLSKNQDAVWQEYREYKFMFKKPSKHLVPEQPKIDPKTGRQKTMELISYLRKKDDAEKMRRKEQEKFRRVRPQKVLMIASPEQKKRKLFDVIGKRAKIGEPTRLSVPPRKKKNKTIE